MLFSSNAASVLALAVSAGHWDVARSLTVPEGEGAASAKKKRLDNKEQPIDLLFEKKRRAARGVEDEENVAVDDAAANADTDAGILRAAAEDKALRGQRELRRNCPENKAKCTGPAYNGDIGRFSCNDVYACWLSDGDIKGGSCNYRSACYETYGKSDVGRNSCNNRAACYKAQGTDVGRNACNGVAACSRTEGNIGKDSCNGYRSCTSNTTDIPPYSCNEPCECTEFCPCDNPQNTAPFCPS